MYLDWHHTNTRKCAWLVFNKVFGKNLGLKPWLDLDMLEKDLKKVLAFIDKYFLG